jgi:hypothetical protein
MWTSRAILPDTGSTNQPSGGVWLRRCPWVRDQLAVRSAIAYPSLPEVDESSGETNIEDPDGWMKRRRISWAQLIRKVFEIDPMLCAFCGGRLQVLSLSLELGAIRRFLASIDCESQEPEPLGHSPPPSELLFEPC